MSSYFNLDGSFEKIKVGDLITDSSHSVDAVVIGAPLSNWYPETLGMLEYINQSLLVYIREDKKRVRDAIEVISRPKLINHGYTEYLPRDDCVDKSNDMLKLGKKKLSSIEPSLLKHINAPLIMGTIENLVGV
jgi:hypothetical protein